MGLSRRALLILLFTGLSASCFSNVPLIGAFGFGIPFMASLKTFGISFALVVIVEGAVIRYFSKYPWKRALLFSLAINALSTVGGVVLFGVFPTPHARIPALYIAVSIVESLVVTIAMFFLLRVFFRRLWIAIPVCVLVFASFEMMIIISSPLWPWLGKFSLFSLVPAFFCTLIIEGRYLAAKAERKTALRIAMVANTDSYFMIVIGLFYFPHALKNPFMTLDYYSLAAEASAKRGDDLTTLIMLRKYRSLEMKYLGRDTHRVYYPGAEMKIADVWISKGRYNAAAYLIKNTLALDLNMGEWREKLRKKNPPNTYYLPSE